MSRIDPSLLNPPNFQINPGPGPVQRAQVAAQQQDIQAQIQERQAQADALRLANQKARTAYNASQGIRAWLANNPQAFKSDPQEAIRQLRAIGGPEADPIIANIIAQDKDAIANIQKHLDFQEKISSDLVAGLSALPDNATDQQKRDVMTQVYQKHINAGTLNQDQANQMLSGPVDNVAELQAHQARLTRARDIASKEAETNRKAQQALEAAGKAEQATAEAGKATAEAGRVGKVPGVDIPFTTEVQAQRIAEKQVPQPPMSDARFKQELALEQARAAVANAIPPLNFIKETSSSGLPYIDAGKVEPKTLNALQTAAGQAQIPVVDKDTAAGLRDAATVKLQQQRMLDLLNGRLADTPLSRLLVAPENRLKQIGQLDPNLAITGTFVGPAIQALRAMAGGKNFRITQAEINNAIDNFVPKATDTVDVARKKVETITGFINDKEQVALGNKGAAQPTIPTNPATGKPYAVGDTVTVKGVQHKITAIQNGKPVVQ